MFFNNIRSLDIKVDEENRIVRFRHGGYAPVDEEGWKTILVTEETMLKFAQKYGFQTKIGACRYKYINDTVTERTPEEIAFDEKIILNTPSHDEIIEAQIMYTAMMTNTLI